MAPNHTPTTRRSQAKAEAKIETARLLQEAVRQAKAAAKGASYVLVGAIDPGPTRSGGALLRASLDGTLAFVSGAHAPTGQIRWSLEQRHDDARFEGGTVILATEIPQWTPRLPFAGALVETARVEGELAASFEAMQGRPPIRLRALDWKRIIGLRPNANDAMVKQALPRLVSGIPRTNCHVRDAIGVAAAAAKLMGLGWKMVDAKEKRR